MSVARNICTDVTKLVTYSADGRSILQLKEHLPSLLIVVEVPDVEAQVEFIGEVQRGGLPQSCNRRDESDMHHEVLVVVRDSLIKCSAFHRVVV